MILKFYCFEKYVNFLFALVSPRGWKPFPRPIVNDLQLPSIICSGFNISWINVSL
jgi:hypothetical protein